MKIEIEQFQNFCLKRSYIQQKGTHFSLPIINRFRRLLWAAKKEKQIHSSLQR